MRNRSRITDDILVLEAQMGHREGFENLARRWHPRLLRFALRLTGDPEGAAEALQDAWIAIARGIARLRDPARFGPWAMSITRRRCCDWVSRQRVSRDRRESSECLAGLPDRRSQTSDDRILVREVLCASDPEVRALLDLFYVDGFSVPELAEAFGTPEGTIKSRLHTARARIRAALEAHHDTPDVRRRQCSS